MTRFMISVLDDKGTVLLSYAKGAQEAYATMEDMAELLLPGELVSMHCEDDGSTVRHMILNTVGVF